LPSLASGGGFAAGFPSIDRTSFGYAHHPRWFEELMDCDGRCNVCIESYPLENLSLCFASYCTTHSQHGGYAANGNRRCIRFKTGEVVG
jgi:hypothetical protein